MSFSPFNEGPTQPYVAANEGIDTSLIDAFRQGVEIPINFPRKFLGVAPKMNSGNPDHSLVVSNYGFSLEHDDKTSGQPFSDNEKFSPAAYLNGELEQTYPILINDGVAGLYDAILQPLTIPNRTLNSLVDVPFSAHRIMGEVMPIIKQYQAFNIPLGLSAFTDSDAYFFGNVRIEGISGQIDNTVYPYDDSKQTPVIDECLGSSETIAALRNLSVNLNGDLREFNSKSMSAGFVFGQYNTKTGTDSITFGDRKR